MSGRDDPVSWLLIEKGWRVVGRDGGDLGSVDAVVGDTGQDIFNGLAVSPGFLRHARYVPAERVTSITERRVVVDLDESAFGRLDEHGTMPTSAEIRSDTTDLE